MAALSKFASRLLEEGKRFLERAKEEKLDDAKQAYLHAALLVGFAAFEGHVNAVCDDFLTRDDLTPHERGLLAEHAVKLADGVFIEQENTLQMQRLEDRLLFLCQRFSTNPIDRQAPYWSALRNATTLRNTLTHPKTDAVEVTLPAVENALLAMIEVLNVLFTNIYGKGLPAYHRQLSSKLAF